MIATFNTDIMFQCIHSILLKISRKKVIVVVVIAVVEVYC